MPPDPRPVLSRIGHCPLKESSCIFQHFFLNRACLLSSESRRPCGDSGSNPVCSVREDERRMLRGGWKERQWRFSGFPVTSGCALRPRQHCWELPPPRHEGMPAAMVSWPWRSAWWHCSEIICLYLKVFINVNGKPVEKQVLYLQLALRKAKSFGIRDVRCHGCQDSLKRGCSCRLDGK